MKIRQYRKSDKSIVLLEMEETTDGGLVISAIDPYGEVISTILEFTPNGNLQLCKGVSQSIGFNLDKSGRIIVE